MIPQLFRRRPVVLMYHGIADVARELDPHNLFIPAEAFAAQLELLDSLGFQVIDEAAYVASRSGVAAGRQSVLITFDDGFVSVLEQAAPILRRRGLPALSFVSAGLIGGVSADSTGDPAYRLMDADQMCELRRCGVELGVHGWDHGSMPGASPEALDRQTTQARAELRRVVDAGFRTFAYPYGHHDQAARAAVRAAGFDVGFATQVGAGAMAVPRVDVNTTDTPRTFRLKLHRAYLPARRLASMAPIGRRLVHHLVAGRSRRSPWSARHSL